MEKVKFMPAGEERAEEFYVLEQTMIGGISYLLVTDKEEGDGEAWILKDLSKDGETEALYEMVEDEVELEAVGRIFAEMLEDVDLEQ
ncbi:MAG TPA: DUF1292 domain-containing protein [Candidatus Merdiplasma excrementigallinarum]|uniref:DUF1292 domain-containing protein n=1 Tax=Candidatus Merdiplasma excrementigallinarum TaxID=2840864 RepID=A0A9D1NZ60_9FIRM|nr:DUF1292 domain-containing protein [Candidatus Merdiplasma excrementigallinarum]